MADDDIELPENALGYFYARGGLNNQKLALFGLFLKAWREGPRRVVLPNLLLLDVVTFNHIPVALDKALQVGSLRDFAARHGIEILDISPLGEPGGGDNFWDGHNYIPRAALLNELTPDSFTCDFFRSLVPTVLSSSLLQRVADATYDRHGIRLAAQLRIEKDWPQHTAQRLTPNIGDTEDNAPSFKDIIAKICNTLSDTASGIYVVCDEAALPVPKDQIRGEIKREFGLDLFWKSDVLTKDELAGLSLLELSMLDFEMCVAAESFVGLSRSTFSNMVALEKYARTGVPIERHYVYNLVGPLLALRNDNGAFAVPQLAAAADPWDPAYRFHLAQIFQESGDRERALELYSAHAASAVAEREEVYISLYRAAQIKRQLGFSVAEVIDAYLRAAEVLPSRAEARHGASCHARLNRMFKEGYEIAKPAIDLAAPADGRFVERWIYEYGLLDEFAVNALNSGHHREGVDACVRILAHDKTPAQDRSRIIRNAQYGIDQLTAAETDRPNVKSIESRHENDVPVRSKLLKTLCLNLSNAAWVAAETNAALRSQDKVQYACDATLKAGLPLSPCLEKNWDNYLALVHTEATTERGAPVLDAGADQRYSAYLPGLHALGYTDLTGINLTGGEAEIVDGVCYRYGDITETDFPRGHFGFVACLSVVEHGVDLSLFLKEMARILRPGGHLFVSIDYWCDPIDTEGMFPFDLPWKILSSADVRDFVRHAAEFDLTLVGEMDLACEQRVVNWLDRSYTFCNLLFVRSSESNAVAVKDLAAARDEALAALPTTPEGDHRSGASDRPAMPPGVDDGLEHEPQTPRYWFNLAQSHRDAGRMQEAVDTYAKRAAMGDSDEEAWYARLQEARCRRDLGDERGFLRQVLAAFNQHPRRAEPLYDLARYYRERGMMDASVLFSEQGLALPRPAGDTLFLEDAVYTWGLQEEYSIAANYARDPARKVRGHAACNWLALNRGIPSGTRDLARLNLFFYTEPANAMMPSFTGNQIEFTPPDGYRPCNPSVTRWGDRIFLVERAVNYLRNDSGHPQYLQGAPITTRNFLLRLTVGLEIESTVEIQPPADLPPPARPSVRGFEDLRIFVWRGGLWCSATTQERTVEGWNDEVLARIDVDAPGLCRLTDWRVLHPEAPRHHEKVVISRFALAQLQYPETRHHEKNWMPLVEPGDDRLQFIYLCDPTRIVDDQARIVAETIPAIAAENFRGGSQAITLDGGWLALIHEAARHDGRLFYRHRFVWFDAAYALRRVSRPFHFNKRGVEFAAGLAWHPDGRRLLVSYGVDDREGWLATVEAAEVQRILEDAAQIPSGAPLPA